MTLLRLLFSGFIAFAFILCAGMTPMVAFADFESTQQHVIEMGAENMGGHDHHKQHSQKHCVSAHETTDVNRLITLSPAPEPVVNYSPFDESLQVFIKNAEEYLLLAQSKVPIGIAKQKHKEQQLITVLRI